MGLSKRIYLTQLSKILSFIFFCSCASGPVETEIDMRKNQVVSPPSDYQSIYNSFNKFSAHLDENRNKNQQINQLRYSYLKTLNDWQRSITKELESTNQLVLRPGYSYEFNLESFCVHAGIERPVNGDGLFIGDMQGAASAWLPQILTEYKKKGISQNDAQILIWSLLSGSKFDQLSIENKRDLLKIFPDAAFRFGNSILQDTAKDYLLSELPTELISMKESYDEFNEILQNSKATYQEIETILSPRSSRLHPIEVGWIKHQDGYYIKITSEGYQNVHVQIYAPKELKPGIAFKPSKMIALPGKGQRLALAPNQSNKLYTNLNGTFKKSTGISIREADFIQQHPVDAAQIYLAAQTALNSTWDKFESKTNFEDDKSDAFRHFVWASLITREIGADRALEYLTAHEDFPGNNLRAKEMDMYNNNKGIQYGQSYRGSNFEEDVIKEGLKRVRNHELRWLK
jgi:hypothetical protein